METPSAHFPTFYLVDTSKISDEIVGRSQSLYILGWQPILIFSKNFLKILKFYSESAILFGNVFATYTNSGNFTQNLLFNHSFSPTTLLIYWKFHVLLLLWPIWDCKQLPCFSFAAESSYSPALLSLFLSLPFLLVLSASFFTPFLLLLVPIAEWAHKVLRLSIIYRLTASKLPLPKGVPLVLWL